MTTVTVPLYVKVRGRDEYRRRTPAEIKAYVDKIRDRRAPRDEDWLQHNLKIADELLDNFLAKRKQ
jgi:hypothetical protein